MALVYPETGFLIEKQDVRALREFESEHTASCWDCFHDAAGALFSYTFTPTGLGTAVTVACSCGMEIHLMSGFDL